MKASTPKLTTEQRQAVATAYDSIVTSSNRLNRKSRALAIQACCRGFGEVLRVINPLQSADCRLFGGVTVGEVLAKVCLSRPRAPVNFRR